MISFKYRNLRYYSLALFFIIFSLISAYVLYYLVNPDYSFTRFTDGEKQFNIGAYGNVEYWDPAISDRTNILCKYYSVNCLETLFYFPEDSIDPKSNLATSWDFEYWLEEKNSGGFFNRGGVKALNITLREGVEFHDGSSWNATVVKWNLDRLYIITGNLTGNAVYSDRVNMASFWIDVESVKPFFTTNWNLSEYDTDGVTFTSDQYAEYIIEENVTLSNPNPYGGWNLTKNEPIHYAPYDMFPIIKQVKINENKQSGGEIRIEFNDWNSERFNNLLFPMISMQSYRDYFDRGIYGHENGVLHSKNPTIINHMVGTGPYTYIEHETIGTPPGGYMKKNMNYWNRSSLEAEAWFDVDKIWLVQFPPGDLGQDARTTAIMTHALDCTIDETTYYPLDYDAIMSSPNIAYIDCGFAESITQITLNCINETWWSWGPPYNYRDNISSLFSDQGSPSGIPRALRKAISFAFDYNAYIDTAMDQRVVRAGSMLGLENIFFNSSIPIADYNLTKAREHLLTTEEDPYTYTFTQNIYNFSMLCSTRGLTASSTDIEWQNITDTNPIFMLNFYWDNTHEDLKNIFENSLRNIGIALNVIGTTNGIPNEIPPLFTTFDGNHSIWSSHSWSWDYSIPSIFLDLSVALSYRDLNFGSWRNDPWAPSTDPSFSWWPGSNFAFCYDEDISKWLDREKFSNTSGKSKWLSKIANKLQNEVYPMIYVSQGKEYFALWKDWEMNFNRGILYVANYRYNCLYCSLRTLYIPGYDIYILIGLVAVSSTILTVKKNKSLPKILIN
ncbi:MAG: Loki-CTERM sorting domain-containing protein [Promethearchaeota archaeon]